MDRKDRKYGFDRLDRRIGRAWSRFWGVVLLTIALVIGCRTASDAGFSLASHRPGLACAALILVLASLCFRSREGMLDLLSDTRSSRVKREVK